MATSRARRLWSFAIVPKCRRGITERYSNQKSNRSPLMSSASPRSGTASRKRWNAVTTAGGTCPRWASATTSTREAGAGTPQARNPAKRPQAPVAFDFCRPAVDVAPAVISSITLRVNYSETDQMGVVYHANYLIWFDRARTELMRETGVTYKELEQQGVYLAVSEVDVRFRAAARYDDLVRVRCWVRELASRRGPVGYAAGRAARGELFATRGQSLGSRTHQPTPTRPPAPVLCPPP